MPILRDRPYVQFNFLVDIGDTGAAAAGFQECTGIDRAVDVGEARLGSDLKAKRPLVPSARPLHGLVLKRGVMGAPILYAWLSDIQNGAKAANRDVAIQLLSEDRNTVRQEWRLVRARIVKHVSGPMNAKGTDVAIEELTLTCERLETE